MTVASETLPDNAAATLARTLRLGLARGRLELRQFFRGRESVIFVFAFPVILLLIFGAIFKGDITPGVPFIRYFVSGIIAAGLMSVGFQSLAIQIPIERDRDRIAPIGRLGGGWNGFCARRHAGQGGEHHRKRVTGLCGAVHGDSLVPLCSAGNQSPSCRSQACG